MPGKEVGSGGRHLATCGGGISWSACRTTLYTDFMPSSFGRPLLSKLCDNAIEH